MQKDLGSDLLPQREATDSDVSDHASPRCASATQVRRVTLKKRYPHVYKGLPSSAPAE
ncbi:uncharacterized protein FTOL_08869 [Fusarium torulosum]|uniref:Uncharacterized protein n=1 Tax=Fusarium torulosum TaxID=33205 RepID=A0AAE8ME12_9HYPO|nr:uncharacterized protein FTOL_08869 [Fusarium torulosum]